MKTKKTAKNNKKTQEKQKKHKNLARTSYYTHGGFWNPQTEIGIQGAYGSQGEREDENSYSQPI